MNGTITKRPLKNGSYSWGYSFFAGRDENGKRIQPTKSGFKRETSDALRRAIAEHQAGTAVPTHQRTLRDFFVQWLEQEIRIGRKRAPKTIERYQELAEYALRRLGDTPLQKITTMAVRIALNELQEHGGRVTSEYPNGRPLADKTIREIGFILKGCLDTAVEWRLIEANPMDPLRKKLPKVQKKDPTVLDRGKLGKLFAAAEGARLFSFIMLASATGCRRGELVALT